MRWQLAVCWFPSQWKKIGLSMRAQTTLMHIKSAQPTCAHWLKCSWCMLAAAAAALTTAATGNSNPLHHAAQAPALPGSSRTLSSAGIPVTVLQSVPVSAPLSPALQATVQLRGMRAAAFGAQSTQLRFRQATAQVLLHDDSLYDQVRQCAQPGSIKSRAFNHCISRKLARLMASHCRAFIAIVRESVALLE
jgi:hypothetical protein